MYNYMAKFRTMGVLLLTHICKLIESKADLPRSKTTQAASIVMRPFFYAA